MKRPLLRVTLLYILVLTLSTWNGLRLWTSLGWADVLTQFSESPTPAITSMSGASWTITGLILFWSLWLRKRWTAKLLICTAAGYSIWYWSERLIWQIPHPNWLFVVIVNLAGIALILLNVKSLSREAHERENENPAVD
jgi:hypothetical protein